MSLIKKRALLSLISLTYSLLFRIAVDQDIAFRFLLLLSNNGLVSGRDMERLSMSLYVLLAGGLVYLIISHFEKIRGSFAFIYLPSILAFVIMPFRSGGFLSFGRGFDTIVSVIANMLIGPAMIILLTCLGIRIYEKRQRKKRVL